MHRQAAIGQGAETAGTVPRKLRPRVELRRVAQTGNGWLPTEAEHSNCNFFLKLQKNWKEAS